MGTVNVAAFLMNDNRGIQTAHLPALLSENITSSASSAQSSEMPEKTELVRISSDVNIKVAFGENPTAVATDVRIIANTPEYFTIFPGYRIAVIDE